MLTGKVFFFFLSHPAIKRTLIKSEIIGFKVCLGFLKWSNECFQNRHDLFYTMLLAGILKVHKSTG